MQRVRSGIQRIWRRVADSIAQLQNCSWINIIIIVWNILIEIENHRSIGMLAIRSGTGRDLDIAYQRCWVDSFQNGEVRTLWNGILIIRLPGSSAEMVTHHILHRYQISGKSNLIFIITVPTLYQTDGDLVQIEDGSINSPNRLMERIPMVGILMIYLEIHGLIIVQMMTMIQCLGTLNMFILMKVLHPLYSELEYQNELMESRTMTYRLLIIRLDSSKHE